jgi:LmbE family N-acetylglucosaminyl deacetylase
MKKILVLLVLLFPVFVNAGVITDYKIVINDLNTKKLIDNNENSYIEIKQNEEIKITSTEDIYGIYIIYELKSVKGDISSNDKKIPVGANSFLHEYIDLKDNVSKELIINYEDNVKIGEIILVGEGEIPDNIEIWNEPTKEADLLLLSTHSDDEQLFFAGLMPTYIDRGAKVQVVYFTNHNSTPKRLHEQIHGLYKIGIRYYPIIGFVPDAWSTNLEQAAKNMNRAGFTEDDAIKFVVEMIRRFKPQVIAGHDELGEYSHGQHILNTHILKKALELSNDKTYNQESIDKYGLWDTPKTYLHLYKDNKIVMDYDIPLDSYNGLTAYEVSKLGYAEHHSQQYTWFTKWLTGVDQHGKGTLYKTAKEIKKYSPCEFGLYRSLVGEDKSKNDMFENLEIRKEKKQEEMPKEIKKDDKNNVKEVSKTNYIYIAIPVACILLLLIIIKSKQKKRQ